MVTLINQCTSGDDSRYCLSVHVHIACSALNLASCSRRPAPSSISSQKLLQCVRLSKHHDACQQHSTCGILKQGREQLTVHTSLHACCNQHSPGQERDPKLYHTHDLKLQRISQRGLRHDRDCKSAGKQDTSAAAANTALQLGQSQRPWRSGVGLTLP